MAIQLSTTVRNARLDQIETTIGTAAVLKLRTGAPPADVATADSGTVVATMTLALRLDGGSRVRRQIHDWHLAGHVG
jgi:hypothetical protein